MTNNRREAFTLMVYDNVADPGVKRTGARFVDDLDDVDFDLDSQVRMLVTRAGRSYKGVRSIILGVIYVDDYKQATDFDDTASVQAAITAAGVNGTIQFAPGKIYYISANIFLLYYEFYR